MFLTEKQKEFVRNANHRYNIKIGARRCGKTYLDILFRIPSKIRELKDEKGLFVILGVSKETIERNVLQPLREIYSTELVGIINSRNIANLFGCDVYCLGAEKISQVSKIQGTSVKYCYADELAKFNKDVFEMLKGSLDKEYSCFDGALNPESNNHWLKKNFIDRIEKDKLDVYLQHYTIFDNDFLPKDFVENLCKEYKSSGEHWYKRLILGEWCNSEGCIYIDYNANESKFLVDDVNNSEIMYLTIGIDYGASKAKSCFKAVAITRKFEKVIVVAECDITTTDQPEKLYSKFHKFYNKVTQNYGRVHFAFADYGGLGSLLTSGLNSYCVKNKMPVKLEDCVKGRIVDRIQLTCQLMAQGRFFVKSDCINMRNALKDAVWSGTKDDERLDDYSFDNDSLDSMEYAIYSFADKFLIYGGK